MGIEQYNDTIWRVNAQKSESMEEILTAQGIGYLKRKLILSAMDSVTTFFHTDGTNFNIKMEGLRSRVEDYVIGQTDVKVEDDIGHGLVSATFSDEEGLKVVVKYAGKGTRTTYRKMSSDAELHVRIIWEAENGQKVTANRYMQRLKKSA